MIKINKENLYHRLQNKMTWLKIIIYLKIKTKNKIKLYFTTLIKWMKNVWKLLMKIIHLIDFNQL